MTSQKRPVRIAGASGGFSDRQRAIHDLAKYSQVDVIIGDWMSECTMTIHGSAKIANQLNDGAAQLFDPSFLGSLGPAMPYLQKNNVKIAVNAGASSPPGLGKMVMEEVARQGLDLKVAWVEGDDVTEQVSELRKQGEEFVSIDTGKKLSEWENEPTCAQ